ncbi:hypothetical protein Tco_1123611 [Tanacetum coccineum]|uniref:Uncharacterized protein n=1 Tax=Tanacetum coccineum TaxID=301880 RepID=A0ABQ5J3U6_9ASTR
MNDARSIEQLAQDNARGEDNNESASGEDEEGEEGEQHSSDVLPHARGLGFEPHRGVFLRERKEECGLSPKTEVQVLHTAQLDVTVSSNH